MTFEDGIGFPESEDVVGGQEACLTPRSIEHRTGMALWRQEEHCRVSVWVYVCGASSLDTQKVS